MRETLLSLAVLVLAALGCTDPELVPGIRTGETLFERHQLARCDELGEVTDIRLGRVQGDGELRLVVAGKKGFASVDPDSGQVARTVTFERTLPPLQDLQYVCRVHDFDGDGQLEFLRVPRWQGPASIHGGDGRITWVDREVVNTVDVEDLDGDGDLEVVITTREGSGTRLLDHRGKVLWSEPWPIWFPEFFDVDGDSRQDIVYTDGAALWARNSIGAVLARTPLPRGGVVNRAFVIRSWEDPTKRSLIAGEYEGEGRHSVQYDYAVSSDAKSIGSAIDFESIRPLIEAQPVAFAGTSAVWSELSPLSRPAPIAGNSATRLRVRLFDASGATVFEEVLRPPDGERMGSEGAACFRAAEGSRPAQLFVAYGPVVWVYRARR